MRTRVFKLPIECDAMELWAMSHFETFDMRSIRLYGHYADFCLKDRILRSGSENAAYDFVSNYDFARLSLGLIPSELTCGGISSDQWYEFCDRVKGESQSICKPEACLFPLSMQSFLVGQEDNEWFVRTDYTDIDDEDCRLSDGAFSGILTIDNNTLGCRKKSEEWGSKTIDLNYHSLRLAWVEYRDMNHHGYMDAVAYVISKVFGSGPDRSVTFGLTRMHQDQDMQFLGVY